MLRLARLLPLLALAALPLAGGPLAGCDSYGSLTCDNDGELETTDQVAGTGAEVNANSTVLVTYTGRLEDGSVFDNQTSLEVDLQQVNNAGFRQGLIGMREGGRRTLVVPPNLGYGYDGVSGVVPRCATLTYDVRLVEVLEGDCPNGTFATEDLAVGTGATATETSLVTVTVEGRLEDGTIFQQPVPLNIDLGGSGVIAGLRQGILGMRVGGRRRVVVPPQLGYDDNPPVGSGIPACAILIFDVELTEVEDI